MACVIYGLYDECGNIRYVGKTTRPIYVRLGAHLNGARHSLNKSKASHCFRWIRSMLEVGQTPTVKQLAEVNNNGDEAERFYIAYFKMLGAKLTNLTVGGDGGCLPEVAKRIVETRRKNGTMNQTTESLSKMVQTKRDRGTLGGWKRSPESIAKGLATRATVYSVTSTTRQKQSNKAKEAWARRKLNGTATRNPESVLRSVETKRRLGVYSIVAKKVWEKRRSTAKSKEC